MFIRNYLIILALSFYSISTSAQEVNVNVQNTGIYDFLDELANNQIITLNSVVKPYSRAFIAQKLNTALNEISRLNQRQKDDLDFYLMDYSKELPGFETTDFLGKNLISRNKVPFKKRIDFFYYKDSLLTLTVNPVLGLKYFVNENGTNYHRWNGAEAFASIGRNWGFYVSLRDNHESEFFSTKNYLAQQTGGSYKPDGEDGGDYEEIKGGITYSWEWGSFGILKDNIIWGNNSNGSNIISDRAPSFPMIKFHANPVKWFEFTYIHGWLSSLVVDSNRTYNFGSSDRIIYHDKYIAANMFTFSPVRRLNISFGNSIIYSDVGIKPVYLIPVLFYKAVDHNENGMNNYAGQNAQMYFDISSRQIRHLHLYTTLFIDEIDIGDMWDKDKQSNWISFKCGFALSDFPITNLTLTTEYTRTNPITYKHFIPTTTFESNQYNMGHYIGDNAQEWHIALKYRPYKSLLIDASYTFVQKGPDYDYTGIGTSGLGLDFLSYVIWQKKILALNIRYELFNDVFITAGYSNGNIRDNFKIYTPQYFLGNTNTFNLGMNWGF